MDGGQRRKSRNQMQTWRQLLKRSDCGPEDPAMPLAAPRFSASIYANCVEATLCYMAFR